MVLECAVAGGAAAIVTVNITDFLPVSRDRFGLELLRPGELLRRLETVEIAVEVREKAWAAIERAFRDRAS